MNLLPIFNLFNNNRASVTNEINVFNNYINEIANFKYFLNESYVIKTKKNNYTSIRINKE